MGDGARADKEDAHGGHAAMAPKRRVMVATEGMGGDGVHGAGGAVLVGVFEGEEGFHATFSEHRGDGGEVDVALASVSSQMPFFDGGGGVR